MSTLLQQLPRLAYVLPAAFVLLTWGRPDALPGQVRQSLATGRADPGAPAWTNRVEQKLALSARASKDSTA